MGIADAWQEAWRIQFGEGKFQMSWFQTDDLQQELPI